MKKEPFEGPVMFTIEIFGYDRSEKINISAEEVKRLISVLQEMTSKKKASPDVEEVLLYLNQKTSSRYRTDTGGMIAARLREGYTVENCKKVIDIKTEHWAHDSLMFKFLRPSTLFRPAHFQEYLNEKRDPYESR